MKAASVLLERPHILASSTEQGVERALPKKIPKGELFKERLGTNLTVTALSPFA